MPRQSTGSRGRGAGTASGLFPAAHWSWPDVHLGVLRTCRHWGMAGSAAGGQTGKPAAIDGDAAEATVADAFPARGDHRRFCGDDDRYHARSSLVARDARGQLDTDALPDHTITSED